LIEYPTVQEAKAAIAGANGTKLLDQTIKVDFAFVRKPSGREDRQDRGGRGGRSGPSRGGRARSKSPGEAKNEEEE